MTEFSFVRVVVVVLDMTEEYIPLDRATLSLLSICGNKETKKKPNDKGNPHWCGEEDIT
jgi:hypothetical protein